MRTWKTWKTEFPDFDHDPRGFFPRELGWVDTSWHNDACPSFWLKPKLVSVFADYLDPDKRENAPVDRFVCIRTNVDGEYAGDRNTSFEKLGDLTTYLLGLKVYTEQDLAEIDQRVHELKRYEDQGLKAAVVDGLGRIDTHPDTGRLGPIIVGDPHRFTIRSQQHVEVYKFDVVWANYDQFAK